jgi:ribosomal protein S18 acetylase RimI-like enzyme
MKLSLRHCTLLDILTVHGGLCQDEKDQVTALGYSLDASEFAVNVWGLGGPRLTLCETETLQPIAVFGAAQLYRGDVALPEYQIWMFTLEDAFRQYGKEITQNIGHAMAESFKELNAERFEVVTLARRLLAQRWYVKLGFEKTGSFSYGTTPRNEFSVYSYTGEKT